MFPIRYINKHVFNPVVLRFAALSISPFAIIEHKGRKSGKTYYTPVLSVHQKNSFIFALTYGENVDWYRNVLAARTCTVKYHGATFQIKKIENIDVSIGRSHFFILLRIFLHLLHTKHFVRMAY